MGIRYLKRIGGILMARKRIIHLTFEAAMSKSHNLPKKIMVLSFVLLLMIITTAGSALDCLSYGSFWRNTITDSFNLYNTQLFDLFQEEERGTALVDDVTQAQNDLQIAKGELTVAKDKVADLENKLEDAKKELPQSDTKVARINQDLNTAQGELDQIETEIVQLNMFAPPSGPFAPLNGLPPFEPGLPLN